MFSKSLFKQSCKASGTMWTIITAAVCFMLACVMLIAGGGNIAETKAAIQDTVIEGELQSQMELRALNYYNMSSTALARFDSVFKTAATEAIGSAEAKDIFEKAFTEAMKNGASEEDAKKAATEAAGAFVSKTAYGKAVDDITKYVNSLIEEKGYIKGSPEAQKIQGAILIVLNPLISKDVYMFDGVYKDHGEEPPRYDVSTILTADEKDRKLYREDYVTKGTAIFLSSAVISDESINAIIEALSDYGVTREKYMQFGFGDYSKIKNIATEALVNYRANYAYRMENLKDGETEESVVAELTKNITQSLLASLPHEVSDALDEIGQTDLYGTLVGTIFFKMAGLLLPIIYLIMTANSLIAGQVDSGSMAYILSTSVKRRTVTVTQALYLVGSLFAMCFCTCVTSIVCLAIVRDDIETSLTFAKLILTNIGAFLVLFAMSGICFLTSCWFNRSKHSMGIGGGLNMFFLVATMLGLFASPILPKILRVESLNIFNYVTIISFFDPINILEGGTQFIWKLLVLVAIGVGCYAVGTEKFVHKDLPL